MKWKNKYAAVLKDQAQVSCLLYINLSNMYLVYSDTLLNPSLNVVKYIVESILFSKTIIFQESLRKAIEYRSNVKSRLQINVVNLDHLNS